MNTNFVIAIDFQQGRNYYVQFNFALRKWNEIYNPYFATLFITEQEAIEYMKKYTDLMEYVKIVPESKAKEDWNTWMNNGGVRRSFKYIEESDSYPYDPSKHTKEDILNFWFTKWDKSIKSEHYRTWPSLYEVYENLWSVNRYESLKQSVFSVELVVRPTSTLETFKQEFHSIVDRCTWIDEEEGYKQFQIFDHNLGQHGVYYFEYKSDEDCKIFSRYSSRCEGNIEKVFDYWQKTHYYN